MPNVRRFLLGLLVILVGCSSPVPLERSTPLAAVEVRLGPPLSVYKEVPSAAGRVMLVQIERSPDPVAVLVEKVGLNR